MFLSQFRRQLPRQLKTIVLFIVSVLISNYCLATDLLQIFAEAQNEDPQVRAAHAQLQAELEAIPQSRALLLPDLTLSANTATIDREFAGGSSNTQERFNSNGYSARLTQPLFRADRWFQLLSAKESSKQALAEYSNAEQDLIIRVAEAYFNILRAEDNLSSAVAAETAFRRQLDQTQERFDVGLIAVTDVHEARAVYDLSRVVRITQEEERDNSFTALETLTNSRYNKINQLDKSMPITNPNPASLQEWIATALEHNLSLNASQHQVAAAKQEVKRQKSGHLPTLDAVASYSHSEDGGISFLGNESDIENYALELNIPIFQGGGTQSRVREAHHRLTQAKENYENQYRTIKQDIQRQHRTVNSDVLRVAARKLALKSSQSALEATEGGYEVGTRNIVDVLQVRNTLFEAQRNYYNAIYDYIIDSLRLKRIAGTLSVTDLESFNRWLTLTEEGKTPKTP